MINFNPNYVPNFDLERLNSLLKDFYELTRIRITVFDADFRELTAYPQPFTAFCQLIHTDPEGHRACKECDRLACEIASHSNKPYVYRCHAGMTECITPLYLEKKVVGYVFFGQIFSYDSYENGWKEIQKHCSKYQIGKESLHRACLDSPLITKSYITSATQILQAVAAYLCLEQMVSISKRDLPEQIDLFLTNHLADDLSAQTICREFGIGKNLLYEISRQKYGMGIAQHIRSLRLEQAKKLLKETRLPLAEVASRCGFKDYNYFITLFKKETGLSPKKYAYQEDLR